MTEYTPAQQHEIEQQAFPGHGPDDNIFHEYTDENGQPVRQYDMDAEEITVTPHAAVDWNTVVQAMTALADTRLQAQLPYVHEAMLEFQGRAHDKIAQFAHANEPVHDIGWGALVEGLTTVLTTVFLPEYEAAKLAFEVAAHVFSSGLEVAVEHAAAQVAEAKDQLEHGVGALVTEIGSRTQEAIEQARPHAHTAITDYMRTEQHPTMDTEWITAMVDWFGFPERTRDTVTMPIVYELDQSFDQLLQQVQAQLGTH